MKCKFIEAICMFYFWIRIRCAAEAWQYKKMSVSQSASQSSYSICFLYVLCNYQARKCIETEFAAFM